MATLEELEKTVANQQQLLEKATDYIQKLVAQSADFRQKLGEATTFTAAIARCITQQKPLNLANLQEAFGDNQVEQINNVFQNAVKQGLITVGTAVTEKSLLLVQEFNASRQEVSRRQDINMSAVKEEMKNQFLGKVAGEEVTVFKDGQIHAIFLIHDVFEPVEKLEQTFESQKPE
jgi:hypothetical protein